MTYDTREVLTRLSAGEISVDDALLLLKNQPYRELGFAKVDTHRKIRVGYGEVIYGKGKTAEQIIKIAQALVENGESTVIITRVDKEKARLIDLKLPITYFDTAEIALVGKKFEERGIGTAAVITAGTSDIPVAEECAVTLEILGNKVERIYDVGVAGLHRLLAQLDKIMSASVIVVIAGMEGALASVVGGLADCPVIAVPTSVGYGASFGGVTALLSMLNCCSSGVSVVNIDNGFGAGYLASMINNKGRK